MPSCLHLHSPALRLQTRRKFGSSTLESELSAIGLRVHEVDADGSCFFRSLADQLEGRSGDHRELRRRVVSYVRSHRENFEPFVEDDEPFDDYVQRMAEEGTWAGHLELHAASAELGVHIRVYQEGQPPWTVRNNADGAPMLHLSYHDGMHYNSVRLADDYGTGAPVPIPVESSALAKSGAGGTKDAVASPGECAVFSEKDLQRVEDGTGCSERRRIEQSLRAAGGDVDAAILLLAEELAAEPEDRGVNGSIHSSTAIATTTRSETTSAEDAFRAANTATRSNGAGGEEADESEHRVRVELEVSKDGKGRRVKVHVHVDGSRLTGNGVDTGKVGVGTSLKQAKQAKRKGTGSVPSRNARCPCGSTKKYKNCCGASIAARRVAASEDDTSGGAVANGGAAASVAAALATLYI